MGHFVNSYRIPASSAALALWLAAATASALPPESDVWHERESPGFRIQGNAPESVTAAYALRFERLRAALALLNPATPLEGTTKLDVFVFRDPASFRPYARIFANSDVTHPAGYFRSGAHHDLIAILPPNPDEPPADAAYVASLVDSLRSALSHAPEWLRSGLTQVYASAAIEDGVVVVGRPDTIAIRFLRVHPLIPCREFLATVAAGGADPVPRSQTVFRAQSWLLVHFLFVSDKGLRRKFTSYLEALAEGAAPDEAFPSAFGTTPEELDRILADYLRQEEFAFVQIPAAGRSAPAPPPASRLPRPEVLTRLGWLLANLDPVNLPDAEAHFRAAFELRPDDSSALKGLAWIRERENGVDEDDERRDGAPHALPRPMGEKDGKLQ